MILVRNKKTGNELTFDSKELFNLANTFGEFEIVGDYKDKQSIEEIKFEVIKPKVKYIEEVQDYPKEEPEIIEVPKKIEPSKKKGRPKKL